MTSSLEGIAPPAQPTRTSRISDVLRAAILSGQLRAGSVLVEAELAQHFGTSKTPVREALKTLAGAGLITMNDYKTAIVRRVDEAMVRDVFDVRCLLEPIAVERSISNGFDAAPARAALRAAAEAADMAARSTANREFHQALYANCGNPLLVQILDGLREQTALIAVNVWNSSRSWEDEAREHQEILACAEAGDGERARELVLRHGERSSAYSLAQIPGVSAGGAPGR
jgi:DNA-binding GntR family transcriptional regulator